MELKKQTQFLRRFQKRIYVPLESRTCLIRIRATDPKVKNQILAKIFEGYSASDIRDVCQSAQLSSVTEMFNSVGYREPTENEEPQTPRALTLADFRTILARRRPSVSVEMLMGFYKMD